VTIPTLIPLLERPRPVDVRSIDRELAELWQGSAEGPEGEQATIPRARTLTLVAHAADPEAGTRLADVAARTSQRHPTRTIILVTDPSAREPTAAVTAICAVRRRDQKTVCCEQVLIHGAAETQERFPSLVRQLVLPDMPVVLYWPGPPPQDELFHELREIADRIIVDTSAPDGPGALLAAAALARVKASHSALSDLTWGRITLWRSLTAHFFDPPHDAALDRITKVRVAHAPSSRAQALLYVGWLAGRLHWRPEEPFGRNGNPWRATLLDPRGRSIAVSLHAASRAPHPGGALLSTLITTAGRESANIGDTFSIARNDDAGGVVALAESEGGQAIRRALPLDPQDEASLLAVEMDVLRHDHVYEESLRAAAALLGPA
jgi:glucose-6-phosphate dehydrogenase assembly protein OpcA